MSTTNLNLDTVASDSHLNAFPAVFNGNMQKLDTAIGGLTTQLTNLPSTAGTYNKPAGGIPLSDLASAVQTSLGKADSALQSVPNTYRAAADQDNIDSGKASAADVSAMKTALSAVLTQLSQLIPKLAFIDASNNGAATVSAISAAISAMGSTPSVTTYTVTRSLTNCASSNSAGSVTSGHAYSTTISANSGYVMSTVTVTMGGTDITSSAYDSSNGLIAIASVTGNVVITASAAVITATLSSISAVFSQGNNTVYDSTALNDLKQYLTVTATYSDSSTAVISAANYTLSGTLSVGTSTITVSYGGKTASFTVTVTQTPPTLSSISAALDLNGANIDTNNSVNDLKQYLTVTAHYSDSSTSTVASNDYTLSGTLTRGTQTITVTHEGKTATFTVFVHAALPSGYTELTYISTDGSQYVDPQIASGSVRHAEYEIMVTALNSDDTSLSSSDQSYTRGNHIFSGRNLFFPYLRGDSSGWQTNLCSNRFGSETVTGENESMQYVWNLNQRYILSGFMNDEIKIDGVTQYHLGTGGSATGSTMIFFGYGYEPNKRKYRFRGRLYYAKLYDSNHVLIHDYVPCKNGSNVVGMYDLVGETFVSSATESPLIAGEVA